MAQPFGHEKSKSVGGFFSKLLIFDLDGTLIDSRRDLTTGINLMREHYGLPPLDFETVTEFVGDGVRQLVERALFDAPAVKVDEALVLNRRFYREHLTDETVLYPGVREGLARLAQQGHTLAVLTNKPGEPARQILEFFNILPFFRTVVGGGDGPELKPDPAGVEHILAFCGWTDRRRVWMVGDHKPDLEVARRAGIRSVFCRYGIGDAHGLVPEVSIELFEELFNLPDEEG